MGGEGIACLFWVRRPRGDWEKGSRRAAAEERCQPGMQVLGVVSTVAGLAGLPRFLGGFLSFFSSWGGQSGGCGFLAASAEFVFFFWGRGRGGNYKWMGW